MTTSEKDDILNVSAVLADWEDEMIVELAKKHNIDENEVLDICVTFLVNEIFGSAHNKQSLFNTIHKSFSDEVKKK